MYRQVLLIFIIGISQTSGISLDSLYKGAQPGQGYDKLLILDSFAVYDGGFSAEAGKTSFVQGYGAIIDLSRGNMHAVIAQGAATLLDIERCVIINGAVDSFPLVFGDSARGRINHITMAGGLNGVKLWNGISLDLKNSIIANNSNYGVAAIENPSALFTISYDNLWNNKNGNYMCWFYLDC